MLDSIAGRDSFEFYCASCHGTTGKGDGPIASALKVSPSDLTSLARRNRGAFPKDLDCRGHGWRPTRARTWLPRHARMGSYLPRARSLRASREGPDREHRHLRWDTAGAGRGSGRSGCTAVQDALCDVPRTERARQRTARRSTSTAATGPDEVYSEEWRRVSERTRSPDHRWARRAISRRLRHAGLG